MNIPRAALALLSVLAMTATSLAGPIEFQLTPTSIAPGPGHPALVAALVPIPPPGVPYIFDPSAHVPVVVPVVGYDPTRLPTPPGKDIHPDGTTHWNNDGYFIVTVHLTDVASGQSADLQFSGRVHMYNQYTKGHGWSGINYFWFKDSQDVTLGGNEYTITGTNHYQTGPASLKVWVGTDQPVTTPEPRTALLAGLGLVPFGLRLIRRKAG